MKNTARGAQKNARISEKYAGKSEQHGAQHTKKHGSHMPASLEHEAQKDSGDMHVGQLASERVMQGISQTIRPKDRRIIGVGIKSTQNIGRSISARTNHFEGNYRMAAETEAAAACSATVMLCNRLKGGERT